MTTAQDQIHARKAALQVAAEHWQNKLAYGDEHIGWEGDRALVLYHEVLTDEMVVQYELPNREPVLVFKVPAEGFDIHRICSMLRDADHRRQSQADIIARADAHNAKVTADDEYRKDQSMGAAKEKLQWAIAKDMGGSIAPLHVTRNAPRV